LDTTTGRGAVTLTFSGDPSLTHWAFYVTSANEITFLPTDSIGVNPPFIGLQTMLRQATATFDQTYLNGISVLEADSATAGSPPTSSVALGLFTADGAGNASVSLDTNTAGTAGQTVQSGTYTVAADGKVSLSSSLGDHPPILYLVNTNQAFVVGTDNSVTSGYLEPQSGNPFSNVAFISSYWGGTETPAVASAADSVSWWFPDGNGNYIGCTPKGCNPSSNLAGTYQIDATGRGVTTGTPSAEIFYVVSPNKVVVISTTDTSPALSVFTNQ
jgi:hypothetical protein